jgi:glycosyltransferase involved in cell wall biosynthesis
MTKIKKEKNVSILTITQYVRFECIKILYQMILKQKYKNILEWVLVEGSQNKKDAELNKKNIQEFINEIKTNVNFKINYIEFSGRKLGGLRNLGNNSCCGDIIVCMDDDDYYPPDRIDEAVKKLTSSNCLIGGVSDVYLYDFFMDKLYKFKGFMEYHSTNNCMAYKKEFLLNHSHNPEIEVGEERSFTLEFTSPLVKLDSRKTIIAISHNFNTFNKRELCLGGSLKTLNTLTEIEEHITNYIDIDIWNQMKMIYLKEQPSIYDIVFLLGGFTKKFNPKNIDLDEGDTSIMELSQRLVKSGKKVAVYADITFTDFQEQDEIRKEIDKKNNDLIDTNINGVQYINWKKFPFNHHFKTLILHRANGFLSGALFPIKAEKVIWDVHDNFINNDQLREFYSKYCHKIDKIMFKSNFQKYEFDKYLKIMPKSFEIIPNGLRIDKFAYNFENVERNPYRFCYVNYYDRGLEFIVRGIFSVIKKLEPRAELHIYTGMDMINDNDFKIKMIDLFSEHGVADHGKQPIEIIAREKHLSNFELYPSNIINEIDCISIRESLVAGCIPLIANFGIFHDRDGLKFDINHEDPKLLKRTALLILNLLKDLPKLNEIRNNFKKSSTICSWDQVYQLWLLNI